jgi:hypothetical protein
MTYIDSDKRISKFFGDKNVLSYIEAYKTYKENTVIRGLQADFPGDLPIEEQTFDSMFSFYAGFISRSCKKYLKSCGLLVCNNSHGDASIARTDGFKANEVEVKAREEENSQGMFWKRIKQW